MLVKPAASIMASMAIAAWLSALPVSANAGTRLDAPAGANPRDFGFAVALMPPYEPGSEDAPWTLSLSASDTIDKTVRVCSGRLCHNVMTQTSASSSAAFDFYRGDPLDAIFGFNAPNVSRLQFKLLVGDPAMVAPDLSLTFRDSAGTVLSPSLSRALGAEWFTFGVQSGSAYSVEIQASGFWPTSISIAQSTPILSLPEAPSGWMSLAGLALLIPAALGRRR